MKTKRISLDELIEKYVNTPDKKIIILRAQIENNNKYINFLHSQLTSALKALEAIRDAPGGGPGRRIASQAIDEIKKVRGGE